MKELEHEPGIEFESDCISAVELEFLRAKRSILKKLQARFGEPSPHAVRNEICHSASAILNLK